MHPKIEKIDWERLHELVLDLVNVSAMDDAVLIDSKTVVLMDWLDNLDSKYGEHHSLLATRADFLSDYLERKCLYERALAVARNFKDTSEIEEILDSLHSLELEERQAEQDAAANP